MQDQLKLPVMLDNTGRGDYYKADYKYIVESINNHGEHERVPGKR